MIKRLVIVLLSIALLVGAVQAQDEGQVVEVAAADGLTLVGDYYAAGDEPAPAVLLMHMYGSQRSAWNPIIPTLTEAGYAVLAVDLRGFGDTGGDEDFEAAQGDVQTWLDWLRQQPGVRADAVSIMGASVGANLALVGCANDEGCVTVIALSPGLDFYNVMPEMAVTEGLRRRAVMLVASHGDTESAEGVRQMTASARGEINTRIFAGVAHGTSLFGSRRVYSRLLNLMVTWLDEQTPEPEA